MFSPRASSNPISAAKASQLADKRLRSEGAYLRAIGSQEPRDVVAFAGSAMQPDSARGKIGAVLCTNGKGDYAFSAIRKAAEVSELDMSRSNLAYIANNFAFRADLVGLSVSVDYSTDTISVRLASREEKADAIRKAASLTGRTFATVAAVTGFVVEKAASKPRKALAAPSEPVADVA